MRRPEIITRWRIGDCSPVLAFESVPRPPFGRKMRTVRHTSRRWSPSRGLRDPRLPTAFARAACGNAPARVCRGELRATGREQSLRACRHDPVFWHRYQRVRVLSLLAAVSVLVFGLIWEAERCLIRISSPVSPRPLLSSARCTSYVSDAGPGTGLSWPSPFLSHSCRWSKSSPHSSTCQRKIAAGSTC